MSLDQTHVFYEFHPPPSLTAVFNLFCSVVNERTQGSSTSPLSFFLPFALSLY